MKYFRRFLLALLGIALVCGMLIAAFYAVEDWRGAREWAAAQHEVRLRSGTTDYAAIIPPPILDDENLAMAPLFAKALDYQKDPATGQWVFGKMNNDPRLDGLPYGKAPSGKMRPTGGGWELGHPVDLAAWAQYFRADPAFPRTPDPQSPAADVLLALSRYSAPLAELAHDAAARPKSRFPIDWNKPNDISILPQHAILLQNLAGALKLRASAELAAGDPGATAADIALVFRLSGALQYDANLIDHLVDVTMLGLLAQPIWEGLAERRWNTAELTRLQTILQREDVLAEFARAVRTQEASSGRWVDFMEGHLRSTDMLLVVSMMMQPAPFSWQKRLLYRFVPEAPAGWFDRNKARIVRDQECLLDAVDPQAHRAFPVKLSIAKSARTAIAAGPYTFFYLLLAGMYDDLLPKAAHAQTLCDLEATACSLERYFIDHQAYPDDLNALVPSYLAKVPNDIIDGAPIHYRRTPDGRYLLYSIGWNERDDGGKLAWKNCRLDYREGDWVWQYQVVDVPASLQTAK